MASCESQGAGRIVPRAANDLCRNATTGIAIRRNYTAKSTATRAFKLINAVCKSMMAVPLLLPSIIAASLAVRIDFSDDIEVEMIGAKAVVIRGRLDRPGERPELSDTPSRAALKARALDGPVFFTEIAYQERRQDRIRG